MSDALLLVVEGGGSAEVVEFDGNHVAVRSSVSSPPGSTLPSSLDGRALRIKVRGCRRENEGERPFRIEGRFVDVSKEQRARILSRLTALAAHPGPPKN